MHMKIISVACIITLNTIILIGVKKKYNNNPINDKQFVNVHFLKKKKKKL